MSRPTPLPRTRFPHFVSLPTRWSDNDVYGHVNNVAYYAFFDTAVNSFLIDAGVLDIHSGEVIGLVVETACSFFESLAFPDLLEIGLAVDRIGTSSVTYRLGVFRQGGDETAALGRFVHVYVDRVARRPCTLPPDFRAVLERLVV